MLSEWVKLFKALGQPTRLKIVLLVAQKQLCVCELEDVLGLTQPAVSQHMRVLKDAGLVREERVGQWVFYSAHAERLREGLRSFSCLVDTLPAELPGLEAELARLVHLEEHPKASCRPPGAGNAR